MKFNEKKNSRGEFSTSVANGKYPNVYKTRLRLLIIVLFILEKKNFISMLVHKFIGKS